MIDVEVRGKYLLRDGTAASGKVVFSPRARGLSAAENVLVPRVPVTATLDVNGEFSVQLQAVDDPAFEPMDFTYQVTERIIGTPAYSYEVAILASAAPGPVELADLARVDPSPGTVPGITSFGVSLVSSASAPAARTVLGLGTAAVSDVSAFDVAGAAAAAQAAIEAVNFENVKSHGALGDGTTDDTIAIQSAIDAVMTAGGGTIFFPRGTYRASGLTGNGVLAFRGEGGGDIRGGTWATDQRGSTLTPASAGSPVITISSSKRLIWRDLDFIHDRSFKADAMVLGSTPGNGVGTFWPDLEVAFAGFDGHALKCIGLLWECDLRGVQARRCGDGANDKAVIEIDGTLASSDGDTVRFTSPNVTFPRAVGFRLRSSANSASSVGPGFKRLMLIGGMFHAGADEDNVGGANRYDADMIVVDGFVSLLVKDLNVASVAAGRWAIKLDGSLTTNGSSRAIVQGCALNGPIGVYKCKDVTIARNTWAFFAPGGEYPEHIYIDAAATRTIVEPQVVVNDGALTVTDNSTSAVKPTDETLLIPATAFTSSTGTPTLGRAGSRFPAWLLDAAVTEQVNASVVVPPQWRRFHVEMLWSNLGPGAGDVRWSLGYSARGLGDALGVGDVFFPAATETAPATDVLAVKTWTSTAVTATRNALYHFRLSRVGADAADTLTNDATFLGLRLRRAA